MSKKSPISAKAAFAVFAISFCIYTSPAITPAMNSLFLQFADQPQWIVSLANSISSLTVLLGLLVFGIMNGRVKYKTIATIGLLCAAVFGMLPALWNTSIWAVLVCRLLHGFGDGLYFSLGAAWFMRQIRDEKQRAPYLSWNQAAGSFGSTAMTFIGGWLCAVRWDFTFYVYILLIVAWIIALVCFQEPKSIDEIIKEEGTTAGAEFEKAKRVKLPVYIWVVVVVFLLVQICQAQCFMLFSTLMDINQAGNAGVAGTLLTVMCFVTMIVCLFSGSVQKVLRQYTTPIFLVCTPIGMLCAAFAGSSVALYALSMILIGLGSVSMGLGMFDMSINTNAAGAAWAASLFFFGSNLGNVLSSFALGAFQAAGGGNVAFPIIAGAIIAFVAVLVYLIMNVTCKGWKQYNANRRDENEAAKDVA